MTRYADEDKNIEAALDSNYKRTHKLKDRTLKRERDDLREAVVSALWEWDQHNEFNGGHYLPGRWVKLARAALACHHEPTYGENDAPAQSRQQVADLILSSPTGGDMVICSDLDHHDGASRFAVMDPQTGFRYYVAIRIEEIDIVDAEANEDTKDE